MSIILKISKCYDVSTKVIKTYPLKSLGRSKLADNSKRQRCNNSYIIRLRIYHNMRIHKARIGRSKYYIRKINKIKFIIFNAFCCAVPIRGRFFIKSLSLIAFSHPFSSQKPTKATPSIAFGQILIILQIEHYFSNSDKATFFCNQRSICSPRRPVDPSATFSCAADTISTDKGR